jgi:hypothetical protein
VEQNPSREQVRAMGTFPLCQMTGHTNRERVRAKRASANKPKSSLLSSSAVDESDVVAHSPARTASPVGTIILRG